MLYQKGSSKDFKRKLRLALLSQFLVILVLFFLPIQPF